MIEWIETVNQEMPYFFPICVFIFGSLCGSFFNVCIYRIPEGRSIVWPPSACACGKKISPFHNIPILSWLLLRGRAACCDQTFSIRYLVVEALTGILFLLTWLKYDPIMAAIGMVFISILLVSTFIDFDHMIIPDRFSIGGAALGLVLSAFIPELHGYSSGNLAGHYESFLASIIGLTAGTAVVYWISVIGELILKKPAMGEGDIKFLACIGAFTGWQGALFALFGGAFVGTILLLPLLIKERLKPNSEGFTQEVPFGPMLALGAILYFLFLENFVLNYFYQIELLFQ